MNEQWIRFLSQGMGLKDWQVKNVFSLFNDNCTIPFIARYRKEKTGNLNEQQIAHLFKEFERIDEFEKRRQYVLETIEKSGQLTDELRQKINSSYDEHVLEDLFLPFKPKRKTKASRARENGLEPLAHTIYNRQEPINDAKLYQYICEAYNDINAVLRGAMDIVVEWISERADIRQFVRNQFEQYAIITSKVIKTKIDEAEKYKTYFDFSEPLSKCPPHRFLAILRGHEEGFLRIAIKINDEICLKHIKKLVITARTKQNVLETYVEEAYQNYIVPSIENEFLQKHKQIADIESIKVFAQNLKQLLLTPPLGEKRVMAIDPGFRTGCKVVCLDEQGRLLHNETIYPHPPQSERAKAEKKVSSLVDAYKIDCIAIGDGTASRETEEFIKHIRFSKALKIYVVSEAGASVYSASDVARQEFPQYDVTVRGAVSIGRRLQDPLAELVKIDPKSIGVGQYQHDVDQNMLRKSLEYTVSECVNQVGVKVNTASVHLLKYVSGIGEKTAQYIVEHRNKIGRFNNKTELLNIPRFTKKIFEQAAGFLRIENGSNPLDNTAIHPDHYPIVEQMAKDLKTSIEQLIENTELIDKINIEKYINEDIGKETLQDIIQELKQPGYDMRLKVKVLEFSPEVKKFEDLKIGMMLNGIITNITHFGAFVNVGIKENGLVHISQISNDFVQNPADVLHIHQHVKVKVVSIDEKLRRFQLSIKDVNE